MKSRGSIMAAVCMALVLSTAAVLGQSTTSSGGAFLPLINYVIEGIWTFKGASPLKFEGATNDSLITTLTIADPTAARTWTLPDATDQFVGRATTDTLTNKTLTAPTITGATITGSTISTPIDSDFKVLAASATYDNTTTAATLTGFSWTVAAGGTYVFDVDLPATMTTVGGLTVSFKLTTATLTSIQYASYAATASDNSTAVSTQGTTTTDATKMFDSKTAAYTLVHLKGSFVVNAGGTFAIQATQNTAATAGDVSIVKIGSFARVTRVL